MAPVCLQPASYTHLDVYKRQIWRGPIIAGTVKQFWTDVIWEDVEHMFIDMPPGTGDVPLTVFQSIPLNGLIIVTSPQELVSMIVEKAVNMAKMMDIPVLGIVENMSYFKCPDCGKEIKVFGESHIEDIAEKYNIKTCLLYTSSESRKLLHHVKQQNRTGQFGIRLLQ